MCPRATSNIFLNVGRKTILMQAVSLPKLLIIRDGEAHYNEQFLYRKSGSKPIYSVKNSKHLTPIWIWLFYFRFKNNKVILMKSSTQLLALCDVWWHREKLKMHNNLLSNTVCNINCILKCGVSSSTLFGYLWWPLPALLVMSSHFAQNKINLLKFFINMTLD